jgi:glycosyltransferase involved in cell wall biosynthesis
MKIAVVSNLYPPAYIGGYEIGMSWIAEELRKRGHSVDIFQCRNFQTVHGRSLKLYKNAGRGREYFDIGPGLAGDFGSLIKRNPLRVFWIIYLIFRARIALARFKAALEANTYDLILLGNPLGVIAPIHEMASDYARKSNKTKIGLFVSDNWVATWPFAFPIKAHKPRYRKYLVPSPPPIGVRGLRAIRKKLRWGAAKWLRENGYLYRYDVEHWFLDFAACCSTYIAAISAPRLSSPAQVGVAHWGLPIDDFVTDDPSPDFSCETLSVVYVGQIEAHKGLVALLQAIALTRGGQRLVVIGDDDTPYAAVCKGLVDTLGLTGRVQFTGKLSQEDVFQNLAACQVMVVPSEWEEPYALVAIQGKLMGLVTVVSNTGGSSEGVRPGDTGYLFEKGDTKALSELLDQIHHDRDACRRISKAAINWARSEGRISATVDKVLALAKLNTSCG